MKNDKSKNIIIALLVIIIIILVTLLVLFATNIISFKSIDKNDTQSTENNINDNIDNNEISNDEMYSSIITEYKNAINDTTIESDYSIISEKYKNVNETIVRYYHTYHAQKFSYSYFDIDSNGIDELIISESGSGTYIVIDVFTYNGANAIKLIDEKSLGDRSSLQIWNNGILYLKGSGGASEGSLTFSKINNDGFSNEIINDYFYRYDNSNDITFFDDVNETNKLSFSSISEVESVHLSGASLVDMNTLEWNNINT